LQNPSSFPTWFSVHCGGGGGGGGGGAGCSHDSGLCNGIITQ